ncbi:MAG: signal peptidase II [Candidatus Woesearchaeota archaeon]
MKTKKPLHASFFSLLVAFLSRSWFVFFLFILLVLIDQVFKHTLTTFFLTPNLGIYITTNTGAGFSLFNGQNTFLAIITFLFLVIFSWYCYAYKLYQTPFVYPAIFLLAGAFSNFIDRIFFGHVIDYLMIFWWPVFNLADVYLTLGAAWFLWLELKNSRKQRSIRAPFSSSESGCFKPVKNSHNKPHTKKQ